jgi:GntR family transcriptional regulator
MDANLFQIQPQGPEPIYRQIIAQVRRLMAAGQLRAGAVLPSVREMAAAHAINPMTVSKAYSLMEGEGLLLRERGKGMLVAHAAGQPKAESERLALLEPALAEVARQARELELEPGPVLARLQALMGEDSA